MGQRPTILDVARQAGVSKSTVSLVLQGNPAVKDSTRDTVRAAMRDIGYVYNRSAATLRSASSGLIGLVINDLRNPFFTEFAARFQIALAGKGFATVLANSDENPALQQQMMESLIEHGVSGFIMCTAYGDEAETAQTLRRAGIPTLQVFRQLSEGTGHPLIAPDYEKGGLIAARHLIASGCQRIAFLGGLDGRPVTQERMSGYLSAMQEAGMPPLVRTGEATRAFGTTTIAQMKSEEPDLDGVICFNDLVALGVLSGCAAQGVTVGRDLRVVGFDDIEECRDSYPPLSSISCGIPEFASRAAAVMADWINDGHPPKLVERTPVELVARASSTGHPEGGQHVRG